MIKLIIQKEECQVRREAQSCKLMIEPLSTVNVLARPLAADPGVRPHSVRTEGISINGWKVQVQKGPIISDKDSDHFRCVCRKITHVAGHCEL